MECSINIKYSGFKPLCWLDSKLILYKKGIIYAAELYQKPEKVCPLKRSFIDNLLSRNSLMSRLLRLDPRAAAVIDDRQIIISLKGKIINIDILTGDQKVEHFFRKGMNNPLNFCKLKNLIGFDNSILYGEYWSNPNKEPVAIYGRKNNGLWEKVFEFSNKQICHIHNIIEDRYTNNVLILTGDSDNESGIWKVEENFKRVIPVLVGKQIYRSCSAYPVENGIVYATDTPLEQNYIIKITYSQQKKITLEKKYEMDGPSIFSTMYNGKMVFSTSVESNPDKKLGGIKCLLDFTRGPGVKTNFSKLVMEDENNGFKELLSFKKDIFPMAFQFGNISFPVSEDEKPLVIYPQCVSKYSGDTLFINI